MSSSLTRWFKNTKASLLSTLRNPTRSVARPVRSSRLGVESLEDRAVPAVHTWTDLGATNNWSDAGNWAGGVPTTGEVGGTVVVFPTSDPVCTQNIAGLVVDRIDFTSAGNIITLATPLGLSGSVTTNQITNSGGINTISGSTINLSGATAYLQVGAGTVQIASALAGPVGIRKLGNGALTLSTTVGNTYTGTTTIEDGVLNLATNTSNAGLSSTIVVGDGAGASSSAVLQLGANDFEIPDGASITAASDGRVNVPAGTTEDITTLLVNGGSVNVAATGIFGIQTGGTVSSNGTAGSEINGAGNLRLEGGTVTFSVADGAAAADLRVLTPITQSGAASLTKTGTGTLEFAQTAANTYTGTTTVANGVLLLNTTTTDAGVSGAIVVGNGSGVSGSAILRLQNFTEIPDGGSVTINSDGLVEVPAGTTEDITTLNVNGGQVAIAPAGGVLQIQTGGTVTANGAAGSQVTGAGVLRLQSGTISFNIANGAARTDLLVSAPITQVVGGTGLTKIGSGVLTLGGANTYTGTTTVNAGVLEVTGTVGAVSVAGGTLAGGGTVGAVAATGGMIAPGLGDSIKTLSTGNLNLSTTFAPAVSGDASDQLSVTGTVNLNGAALTPTVIGSVSATAAYTLINNDGSDAVIGTFAGLPQGAVLNVGGQTFVISYTGGSGNDVTLTPTVYSNAFMLGNFLILQGAALPGGFQFYEMPAGTFALFADITGDAYGDVILILPTLVAVIDGATGRFAMLSADLNGDRVRDLQIFNPDGTSTITDGVTGIVTTA